MGDWWLRHNPYSRSVELRWLSINAKSSRAGASESPWCRCGSRRLARFFRSEAIFPNNSYTRYHELVAKLTEPAATQHCARWSRARACARPTSPQNTARSETPVGRRSHIPDIRRQTGNGHRPHVGKRPAPVAEIVIDWHQFSSSTIAPASWRSRAAKPRAARRGITHRSSGGHHLSGDMGMSTPPLTCLTGPSAPGITSNAKMSVGSQSVAQALGMSTTPEMWPWHGAVPRIA